MTEFKGLIIVVSFINWINIQAGSDKLSVHCSTTVYHVI